MTADAKVDGAVAAAVVAATQIAIAVSAIATIEIAGNHHKRGRKAPSQTLKRKAKTQRPKCRKLLSRAKAETAKNVAAADGVDAEAATVTSVTKGARIPRKPVSKPQKIPRLRSLLPMAPARRQASRSAFVTRARRMCRARATKP